GAELLGAGPGADRRRVRRASSRACRGATRGRREAARDGATHRSRRFPRGAAMSVRIARLEVRDFGPLRALVLEPADLTGVYGANESGKTSCIDALVRALRDKVRPGNRKLIENLRDGAGFARGPVELRLDPEDGGALVRLLREHPTLARLFIVRD